MNWQKKHQKINYKQLDRTIKWVEEGETLKIKENNLKRTIILKKESFLLI